MLVLTDPRLLTVLSAAEPMVSMRVAASHEGSQACAAAGLVWRLHSTHEQR